MRAKVFSKAFVASAIWALLALLAAAFAVPAAAQTRARDGVQPLDRLLPGIRREHPGNFYDAEGPTYGPSGDPHYHLKWMTPDGRVIWFDADARNGRVLRSSPGRDRFDAPSYGDSPRYGDGPRYGESPRYRDAPPPRYARPYGPGGYGAYPPGGRFAPSFNRGPRYDRPSGGWRGGGGRLRR